MKQVLVLCMMITTFALASGLEADIPPNTAFSDVTVCSNSDCSNFTRHFTGFDGYSHSEDYVNSQLVRRYIDPNEGQPSPNQQNQGSNQSN